LPIKHNNHHRRGSSKITEVQIAKRVDKNELMGKAAGDIVQERAADVEAGAVAYACGATADRDRDSASLLFCHGRRRGLVRQSIER